MKKNISVNIFGTLYPIDEDAYELLQKYNENMRRYYSRMEDGEEIADDIEHRVAELLSELRAQGVMAITIEHVKEIITRIGDPQEMDDPHDEAADSNGHSRERGTDEATAGTERSEGNTQKDESRRQETDMPGRERSRKLFRDPEDKVLGGVLSGISHYFGIKEPFVLRLLMILLFILPIGRYIVSFSSLVIIYIIAWILIPEAVTPEDRLRMFGKPVSAKAINEELMRGANATSQFVNNPQHRDTARGCLSFAIKFVLFCIAAFVIFILGTILFAFLSAIFGIGIAGIAGTEVLMDAVGTEFYQVLSEWPQWMVVSTAVCALLVVGIPLFGLIRALVKRNNEHLPTWTKVTLIALWILSLITLIAFCFNLIQISEKHLDKIEKKIYVNGEYVSGSGLKTLKKQGWTVEKLDGVGRNIADWGIMPDGQDDQFVSLQADDNPSMMSYNLSQERQLKPGTYLIDSYVRADGEGNALYVITNNEKDTLIIDIAPFTKPENKISDEEVIADGNDPSSQWSHTGGTFVVKQTENVKFGISNESQLSNAPWNGQKIDIAEVKIKAAPSEAN